jgi:hypothetical protein
MHKRCFYNVIKANELQKSWKSCSLSINKNETIIFKLLPGYDCLNYQTQSPQMQIKLGVQPLPVKRKIMLIIVKFYSWLVLGRNQKYKYIKGSMNCAIHGVVHSYPHCVSSERDHSTRNEWLNTKEKGGSKCQIQG